MASAASTGYELRRESVMETLEREIELLRRSARSDGSNASIELIDRSAGETGNGDLCVSIVVTPRRSGATGKVVDSGGELTLALACSGDDPDRNVFHTAALLGLDIVACGSVDEMVDAIRSHVAGVLAEPGNPSIGLGWLWYLAGSILLLMSAGPWLRHFEVDFQPPPLDWRVLAPRHAEYVPIWVTPTIGLGLVAFLGLTLWRVGRIRGRTGRPASPEPPVRPRAAPVVLILLLVPFLTNAFFMGLFLSRGRIIVVETEAIHSQGLGMLTTYYRLADYDTDLDQFRYARPKNHHSANVIPFWQPWGFTIVFLLTVVGMALLLCTWRRRFLLAG